jgi:hypothetical protein
VTKKHKDPCHDGRRCYHVSLEWEDTMPSVVSEHLRTYNRADSAVFFKTREAFGEPICARAFPLL